jgi:FKBP-type peptidyl-prolyl cis-trans isomerase
LAKKKAQARRQQPRARYRTSAAAARARQQQRRRGILVAGGAIAIILAIVMTLIFGFGASKKDTAATTSAPSSSTSTAPGSARGKPCVKLADALPKGAPAVPVQTGPPPTKLVTRDLKAGTGAVITASQTLTVDYIGVACSTGKIFDSSYSRNQPATFALSGVIKGWQQGIPGMKVGGERLLGIPSDLAYGSSGQSGIAPDEALWFVVHVRSAK